MSDLQTDVAIIGAGAAGLAAARRLHARNVEFLLLEARERIGGRAHTALAQDGSPAELGAEFIHGTPEVTFALLRECEDEAIELSGEMVELREGKLHSGADMWEAAQALLERIDLRGPDCSVEDFLTRLHGDGTDRKDLEQLRTLIEGFDAAVATDASAIGIATEWRSGINDRTFRPAHGYGPLVAHLGEIAGKALLLGTRVETISWSGEGVRLRAMQGDDVMTIAANRAIVTLPIGVLREQRVLFEPRLPQQKQAAIDAISMGPVDKVVFEFRSRFWESAQDGIARNAAFVRAAGMPVGSVWTRWPQRTPLLCAWAGGGAAQRLRASDLDPVIEARKTIEELFPSVDLDRELLATHYHDWQSDPYACGAYSYLRVGAGDARTVLAQSLSGTLFFAGEATSTDESGTVAGALESGARAADEITSRPVLE